MTPAVPDHDQGGPGRSPGRPRLYEPEDERNRILAATLEVLRRNAGEEATVADILQKARLSTRAFYRHFETKEDAVRALYERDAEAFAARLQRHVDEAADPPAALEAWINEVLGLAFDRRRAERVSALDSPMARRMVAGTEIQARGNRLYVEPLLAVLRQGRDSGDFPGARPEFDVHTIRAITWETIDWVRAGTFRLTRRQALEHVLRFSLPALRAHPPKLD